MYYRKLKKNLAKDIILTHCAEAWKSKRLGNCSFAHSLNRINSSGLWRDNEQANYFFSGLTGVEQGITAVFRCNNDMLNSSEMSSPVVALIWAKRC